MTLLSSVPSCVSFKPKWLQMTPACLPGTAASSKRCSFQPHASSHLAVNKRSLIHQIPHLLLPTLQSDAVIFTSTPFCVMLGFFFFFHTFSEFCWSTGYTYCWTRPTLFQLKFTKWTGNWFEAAFKSAIHGQKLSFKHSKEWRMQKKKHCISMLTS